jgi:ribosomal protein L7Ae-like RNA K-turn-binding protein
MKEVAWAVGKPGRTKLVLLAPNIQIPSPDSPLLNQVLELVNECHEAGVPVIMGPTRKQLGMAFRTSGAHRLTCSQQTFSLKGIDCWIRRRHQQALGVVSVVDLV